MILFWADFVDGVQNNFSKSTDYTKTQLAEFRKALDPKSPHQPMVDEEKNSLYLDVDTPPKNKEVSYEFQAFPGNINLTFHADDPVVINIIDKSGKPTKLTAKYSSAGKPIRLVFSNPQGIICDGCDISEVDLVTFRSFQENSSLENAKNSFAEKVLLGEKGIKAAEAEKQIKIESRFFEVQGPVQFASTERNFKGSLFLDVNPQKQESSEVVFEFKKFPDNVDFLFNTEKKAQVVLIDHSQKPTKITNTFRSYGAPLDVKIVNPQGVQLNTFTTENIQNLEFSIENATFSCVGKNFTEPVHIKAKSIAKLENCHFASGSSLVVTDPVSSMKGMSFSNLALTAPSLFLDGVSLGGIVSLTVNTLHGVAKSNKSHDTLLLNFKTKYSMVNDESLSLFSTLKGTLEIYGASFEVSAKHLKELNRLTVFTEDHTGEFKFTDAKEEIALSRGLQVSVPGSCLIAGGLGVKKELNLNCGRDIVILAGAKLVAVSNANFITKSFFNLGFVLVDGIANFARSHKGIAPKSAETTLSLVDGIANFASSHKGIVPKSAETTLSSQEEERLDFIRVQAGGELEIRGGGIFRTKHLEVIPTAYRHAFVFDSYTKPCVESYTTVNGGFGANNNECRHAIETTIHKQIMLDYIPSFVKFKGKTYLDAPLISNYQSETIFDDITFLTQPIVKNHAAALWKTAYICSCWFSNPCGCGHHEFIYDNLPANVVFKDTDGKIKYLDSRLVVPNSVVIKSSRIGDLALGDEGLKKALEAVSSNIYQPVTDLVIMNPNRPITYDDLIWTVTNLDGFNKDSILFNPPQEGGAPRYYFTLKNNFLDFGFWGVEYFEPIINKEGLILSYLMDSTMQYNMLKQSSFNALGSSLAGLLQQLPREQMPYLALPAGTSKQTSYLALPEAETAEQEESQIGTTHITRDVENGQIKIKIKDKDAEILNQLLDNAMQLYQAAVITPLVPLTKAQIDSLSVPIVHAEKRFFTFQKKSFEAIVPVLYLSKNMLQGSNKMYGASITVTGKVLEVEETFNGGVIRFIEKDAKFLGNTLKNFGAILAQKNLHVSMEKQIINHSVVELILTSLGHLNSVSSVLQSQGLISAQGDLTLDAAQLSMMGSRVVGDNVEIILRDTMVVVPVALYNAVSSYWHNGHHIAASLTHVLSGISAQSALRIRADNGGWLTAATLEAGNEGVAWESANKKFCFGVVLDKEFSNNYQKSTKRRGLNKKTTITEDTKYSSQVQGTTISTSGPVTFFAKEGIEGVAVKINAASLETLEGSGDIRWFSAFRESFEDHYHQVAKKGLMARSGRLVTAVQKTVEQMRGSAQVVPTTLIIGGKTLFYSDGLYYQQSTEVITESFEVKALKGVTLDVAIEKYYSQESSSKKEVSFGFDVSIREASVGMLLQFSDNHIAAKESIPVGNRILAKTTKIETGGKFTDQGATRLSTEEFVLSAKDVAFRTAYGEFLQLARMNEKAFGIKFGLRNNLATTIDAAQNAVASVENADFSTDESAALSSLSIGLASFGAYYGFVSGIASIATGQFISVGLSATAEFSTQKQITRGQKGFVSFYEADKFNIDAENVLIEGLQVSGKDAWIHAKKLLIENAFNSYSTKAQSLSVGAEAGLYTSGPSGSLGFGRSLMEQKAWHAISARFQFTNNITFDIEGLVDIKGAIIEAGSVKINASDLFLASIQDLMSSHGWGLDVQLGTKAKNFLSGLGGNVQNGDMQWVGELTKIIGKENVDIVVANALHLVGSLIGIAEKENDENDEDDDNALKLTIKAAELFARDLYGYDEGITLGAAVAFVENGNNTPFGNTYKARVAAHSAEQIARATITKGKVEIGGNDLFFPFPGLNSDPKQALSSSKTLDMKEQSLTYTPIVNKEGWNSLKETTQKFLSNPVAGLSSGLSNAVEDVKEQARNIKGQINKFFWGEETQTPAEKQQPSQQEQNQETPVEEAEAVSEENDDEEIFYEILMEEELEAEIASLEKLFKDYEERKKAKKESSQETDTASAQEKDDEPLFIAVFNNRDKQGKADLKPIFIETGLNDEILSIAIYPGAHTDWEEETRKLLADKDSDVSLTNMQILARAIQSVGRNYEDFFGDDGTVKNVLRSGGIILLKTAMGAKIGKKRGATKKGAIAGFVLGAYDEAKYWVKRTRNEPTEVTELVDAKIAEIYDALLNMGGGVVRWFSPELTPAEGKSVASGIVVVGGVVYITSKTLSREEQDRIMHAMSGREEKRTPKTGDVRLDSWASDSAKEYFQDIPVTERKITDIKNKQLEKRYKEPPFWAPNSVVTKFNAKPGSRFVRAYNEKEDSPMGHRMFFGPDIENLSANEIQRKFALPCKPTHLVDVTPRSGTEMVVGITGSGSQQSGSGTQLFVTGEINASWYTNKRPIP